MTLAGAQRPATGAALVQAERPGQRFVAAVRLERLHLASRRGPGALVAMVACAAVFQAALRWHGDADTQQIPLIIEAATASIVAISAHSPFGESERATGRWLPYLRLGTAVGLTGAAFAALAAGAVASSLLGGTPELLRNVAGIAGVGMLSAAVLGGSLAWIGPMAYLAIAEEGLSAGWHTPWTWPARPPDDLGASICAALVLGAGLVVIAIRGARDTGRG